MKMEVMNTINIPGLKIENDDFGNIWGDLEPTLLNESQGLKMEWCEHESIIPKLTTDNIKQVIFNPPATIVIFDDETKGVSKCHPNDEYDKMIGFAMAFTKGVFGSSTKLREFLAELDKEDE